MFFIIIIQTYA